MQKYITDAKYLAVEFRRKDTSEGTFGPGRAVAVPEPIAKPIQEENMDTLSTFERVEVGVPEPTNKRGYSIAEYPAPVLSRATRWPQL